MDDKKHTDISVVIVSYKCLMVLCFALDSLKNALRNYTSDVYVVDNASDDGTVGCLRKNYPWVTTIASSENLGFSRANNLALAKCRGKVVLVLNPDTIVPEQTITELVCHFDKHPDSGAVGVQMTNGFGEYLRESKRGYPDVLTSFFKLSYLWRLFPTSGFLNNYYIGNHTKDDVCRAPILSGACVAFSHSLMDEVGVFDPCYFMYGEDIDLSWRLNEKSAGNVYRGDCDIIHFKGACTPRKMKYIYAFYDAMLLFAKRYEYPKHNCFVNVFVSAGIRMGFLFAAIKCLILRVVDRHFSPKALHRVKYVVDDNLSELVASEYDAIVFDVEGDVASAIDFMKNNACKSLFGFYNRRRRVAFVYEGNGCRSIELKI